MSLKMKLAAAAMVVGATTANAQMDQIEKDMQENPVATKAVLCLAVAATLGASTGASNDPLISGVIDRAISQAQKAYGDNQLYTLKSAAYILSYSQETGRLKATDRPAYFGVLSEMRQAVMRCSKTLEFAPK